MEKNKFKIGDVVICVDDSDTHYLTVNKEYIVVYVAYDTIKIKSGVINYHIYDYRRFKLKEEVFQLIEIY